MNNSIKLKSRCQSRHMYATVQRILEDYPETRSSDKKLLIKVYQHYGLDTSMPFEDFIFLAPSYDTITRARRRAQENFPTLCGCDAVEEERFLSEEAYKKWSKTI